MHSQGKGKLPWIGHNFHSIGAQAGEMSHSKSENSWVAFLVYLFRHLYRLKAHLAQTDESRGAGKKISATLGSVSTSMHERKESSWCVRWHSKQDHCTAASAEQNYYFLLLFSACESRPQARLVFAAEKQKEAQICFYALQLNSARHSTSFWRSWASPARSDQTPFGFARLRRKHTFLWYKMSKSYSLLKCVTAFWVILHWL